MRLHGPVITNASLDRVRACLSRTHATALKVVTGWAPGSPTDVLALGLPVLVRTVTGDPASGGGLPDAEHVVAELTPWYAAGARLFEIGNEPNAGPDTGDDPIWAWQWHFGQALTACRAAFPDATLVGPGLMTDPSGRWLRWLEIASQSPAAMLTHADAISIHAYSEQPGDTGTLDLVRAAVTRLCPGKPVYLTEYGAHDPHSSDAAKGQSYGRLASSSRLAGLFYFHLSDDPTNNPPYCLGPDGETAYGVALGGAPVTSGLCPFATWKPTSKFWAGNMGRKAVVVHITAGTSSLKWLQFDAPDASAHFLIAKDGTIFQMVSITDSAWANGLSYDGTHWINPQNHLVHPAWPGLTPPTNPNRTTISIEHEGLEGDTFTPAQQAASARVIAWIASQYPSLAPVVGQTLIRHTDIDPVDRPNCPGAHVDLAALAAAAGAPPPPPPVRSRWKVSAPIAGYLHEGASRTYPVALQGKAVLLPGMILESDATVTGELVNGSSQWLHEARGIGFIHSSQVIPA